MDFSKSMMVSKLNVDDGLDVECGCCGLPEEGEQEGSLPDLDVALLDGEQERCRLLWCLLSVGVPGMRSRHFGGFMVASMATDCRTPLL